MKQCSKCGESKPLSEYHRDKHSKDGHVQRCKECVKIKTLDWLEKNRERNAENCRKRYALNPEPYKQNAYNWVTKNKERKKILDRQYQINNPHVYRNTKQKRKVKLAQNGVYDITRKELKKLYESPCVYCANTKNIQADHVIPIARGGTHSIGNLVSACKTCNTSKGAKTITEWQKKNP